MRTTGPILELGCGWYSTPLLHEIARGQRRTLYTYDNAPEWLAAFKPFEGEWHKLIEVEWWGDVLFGAYYGLVFVDNGQPIEREYLIRRLIDKADVFVMHDTEEKRAYGYGRTLAMFNYRWTDTSQPAHTTVASNKVDVRKWGLTQLKPRGLTEDIT